MTSLKHPISLMAVLKHRKLFPYAPAVSINQTDCPDFCYPFAEPDLPPPPPPIYVIDQDDPNHNNMSPYVVLTVSLLASLLILIGYYVIVVKSCKNLCGSSGSSQSQSSISDEEDFLAENQVDNPVWFISTVGLQQAIINSIAVCRYKEGEGLIEGTECSVCLNEFQDDEMLRLLPKCSHAFHIACIDTWLRSHTNCPLCRANIMCLGPSNDGLYTIEESQMENSDTEIELDVNDEMELVDWVGENRADTENEREENEATQKDAYGNYCILELVKNLQNAEKLHLDAARKRHVSIGQCLHISPVLMKRSFACGGRLRFLSSRRKWSVISILGM